MKQLLNGPYLQHQIHDSLYYRGINMKKTLKKISILCIGFSLVFLNVFGMSIRADYYEPISINPVFPNNQNDSNSNYFDLLLQPGSEQTIKVEVTNKGNHPMDLVAELYSGSTGTNGTGQYMIDKEYDESLVMPIDDLVKIRNNRQKVNPGETVDVILDITMINEGIEGIVLGGIRMYSDTKQQDASDMNSLQITNRLNYLVAIQLRTNDSVLEENLNLVSFGAKAIDLNPAIYANVQNDQGVFMSNVKISGKVYRSGTRELIGSVNLTDRTILPNTNFDVSFDLMNEKLRAGIYDMNLNIEDDYDSWEWTETFEISSKDVSNAMKDSIVVKKVNYGLIIIILLVAIIFILLFILFKKRRKTEAEES